ncbi:MAG TPA: secretin N-terminal domain-containing protein [Aquabacterium sp.]|uniref:secretin N-terminal domain-containing protein n=1 Tax=Aquabacterium sp. TaxID=1872578 RepID=UPI002E2F1392|nr:secretin N-terminal domain-containing protein [Aquabacterium sp.]HEX5373594.1 secretin N-terminal domain-containing protein [Aquabacterium sp.]
MWRVLSWVALPLLLSACANPALREAEKQRDAGQYEAAVFTLQAAHRDRPDDATLKGAYVKQRDSTLTYLLYQAEATRASGSAADYQAILARLEAVAPGHPRVIALKEDLVRKERIERQLSEARAALQAQDAARAEAALRAVLADEVNHPEARALLGRLDEQRGEQTRRQSVVRLATAQKPVTLEFREAALRQVFEALARAANVNFVFDKDVRGEAKVTLFLRNTTVDEALRVILNTQQLGSRLLNDNTVLVFPNTQQKQRDLLDTVTRSFYLVNADPKQAQNLVRTVAKTRDMFVDERLNLLVVRDTPEVMRLVERLIAGIDLPDPEVMLELEVMEVSSKRLNELGLSWPDTVNYGLPGGPAVLSSTSGLRWSTSNPLAVATLKGSTDSTNLLANPKIRARNREKAKVLLGEKLPVFTTTSTANVGVSASVAYLDVGLKLELEPQVQLDNEVIIKVALEVSSITGKVAGPQGSLAYQVGTRQATTSLRLRDGETQVLAGLISDEDSKNAAGLPWIHDLPVLGRLFGKTTDTRNKTEVVLLVTPRIVRNLSQAQLPSAAMPSGTEAQPGAAPFTMSQGQVSTAVARGSVARAEREPRSDRRDEGAPQAGMRLTGPELIQPGASFQITVHNPLKQASSLIYDTVMFESSADASATGRVLIHQAQTDRQVLTFRVKKDAPPRAAEFSLDASDATLTVRLGAAAEPGSDAQP